MNRPGDLERENKTLRNRISMLSAAILRISESLEVRTGCWGASPSTARGSR